MLLGIFMNFAIHIKMININIYTRYITQHALIEIQSGTYMSCVLLLLRVSHFFYLSLLCGYYILPV